MNTIRTNPRKDLPELDVLDNAMAAFQRETGLKAEKGRLEMLYGRRPVDAVIRIEEPMGPIEYMAEIRMTLTDTTLGRIVQQFADTPGKWIVVATHVPTYLAKKMKGLGLQFIDTAGNAYINEPPLMIFLYGNRPEKAVAEPREEGLLGTGGIRILFSLLCKPQLVDATYREIAHDAGVALGTVAGVMKGLAKAGYLLELGNRGRRLTKKNEVVDKWTRAYAERFRHRRLIGRFTANRPNIWEDLQLAGLDALWGGEVAANKLTQYLKPAIVTIYTHKPIDNLVLDLKLRRDEEGAVELREQFWRFELQEPATDIVPPLLVYADLLATADTRNIETARMLYDQYLKRHFD